jgi:hypothetical protein
MLTFLPVPSLQNEMADQMEKDETAFLARLSAVAKPAP